jgi:NAD(P)H-flavin reductase
MDNKNIYQPISCEVINVIQETELIKTIVLKPEEDFSFSTGQFVSLTIPGTGESPFTPSSSPSKTDTIEITIMKAGVVTGKIHELTPGKIIGMRGPFGKGYPLADMAGKDILIVGGGVGIAPLRSFLLTLFETRGQFKDITLCYGAKTPRDIVYNSQFEEWKKRNDIEVLQSIDKPFDGWPGTVGVVTVLLNNLRIKPVSAVAVVCGPPIMMKFSTLKLLELGFQPRQIYLSMEKNMSCGLGKCGHCQMGSYFVCRDGPVMTDEMVKDIVNAWDQ